jgi:hypothetical protein
LEENNVPIKIPQNVTKVVDKITLIKNMFEFMVENREEGGNVAQQDPNQSGMITCVDCQNYEANLQKL